MGDDGLASSAEARRGVLKTAAHIEIMSP